MEESSESEFEPGYTSKRRSKKRKRKGGSKDVDSLSDYVRTTGRNRGVVSYKDFYGSGEGSDEGGGEEGGEGLGEEEMELVPLVMDNRETIEKILKKRIGTVGGT